MFACCDIEHTPADGKVNGLAISTIEVEKSSRAEEAGHR
jgi:hypothetical protein